MTDPLRIVYPLQFNEAIAAADARKVVLPGAYYGELQGAARAQAFSIAGVSTFTQLKQALDAMNEGLRSGMTFGEWKAKAADADWRLPDNRLDLILRMHTQTAYQAGHWQQFDRLATARGFLMYSAINDSRTRPAHRAMDGVIRPVGDSFWDDHSPPCGYNCRCSLVSLTGDQADVRGGETSHIPPEARADPGFGARPLFGLPAASQQVGRAITSTTGTFQDAIAQWYASISEERIIERVQDFVPNYDRVAEGIQDFIVGNDGLIAEHEAVALRYYTGSGYSEMNAYLRGVGDDMNARAAVGSAIAAAAKMPAFEGAVYRGIDSAGVADTARFWAAHQPGEVVEYAGFTSASYEKGFTGDVLYVIRSLNGRVVEELAYEDTEREVLFLPGTRFRVVSVQKIGPATRIELEELEDQNVAVPDSNRFARTGDGGNDQPAEKVGHALQSRAQDQANFADPHALAKFKAEHDGMTPLEYLVATLPSVRMELAQHAPQLLAKKAG